MNRLSKGITAKDAALLALLAALAAWLHGPVLWGGGVYFTNDLIHINHPWRVMTAEQLQKGQLPLWNPFSYFGLPLSGMMQTGQFFPLSLIFDLFRFEGALGAFLLVNHILGGFWTYLWMRSWGSGRWGALGAAASLALGGYALGYLQFPNLLATVLQLPGLFLFWGRPWLLALQTAAAFHAGYPVFWAASLLALFAVRPAWPLGPDRGRQALRAAAGTALGLALSALVLLPGLELARLSNRRGGIPSSERLGDSMAPADFTAFLNPEITRLVERGPQPPQERLTLHWTLGGEEKTLSILPAAPDPVADRAGIKYTPWKSCYIGASGFLLALAGFLSLARRRPLAGAWLAALGGAAVVVLAGNNRPLSKWLWENFTPLLYVRGPARFAFLPLAGLVPLLAAGMDGLTGKRRGWGALAAAVLLAELAWTGKGFYPAAPRGYFQQRGEFVEFLRDHLGGDRYFLYPRSDVWAYVDLEDSSEDYRRYKKMVFDTYKQKLFGISNGVFHFFAATGDYESLFPDASGGVMRLIRDADPKRVGAYLKWAGARFWFNRDPLRGSALSYQGLHLWQTYRVTAPVSSAYWLPRSAGALLEGPLDSAPETMKERPWSAKWEREDRLHIRGSAPEDGLLYLAQPNYPGWEAYVNGKKTALSPAWEAFLACGVPAGEDSVALIYRPWSWTLGLTATLLALAAGIGAGWGKILALSRKAH